MKVYKLERRQIFPISISSAWDYFSDPRNLKEITPDYLSMNMVSCDSSKIYSGMVLEYQVKPLFNRNITWLSEIKHVREPYIFVDEQKAGPYKLWFHIHKFRTFGSGVEVEDRIYYSLPGGIFSELINRYVVANRLNGIFNYRKLILEKKFGVYHENRNTAKSYHKQMS